MLTTVDRDELAIEIPEGGFELTQGESSVPIASDGSAEIADGLIIKSKGGHKLYWQGKKYRGHLQIKKINGKYALINVLEMDDYIAGVLASEVDTKSWPEESLRAQAVVSRSYAISLINAKSKDPYDLGAKANYQVYFGATFEDPNAREAVKATAREVLADTDGDVLAAYFHSCCGGFTEDPQAVWSEDAPALVQGVSDFGFCKKSPYYSWVTSFSREDLESALRKMGYPMTSSVQALLLGDLTRSSRVLTLKVVTRDKRFEIPTTKLRDALGPNWIRSTRITQIRNKDDHFVIHGKGWGHGVGLCQWGAKGMADRGWSYKRILKMYFPKSRLAKI